MPTTPNNAFRYPDATVYLSQLHTAIGDLADDVDGAIGGAWTVWTPTLTGWGKGAGTVTGRYRKIGKTVHFRILLTLGAGFTAPSTGIVFTLPTAVAAIGGKYNGITNALFTDVGSNNYLGLAVFGSNTVNLFTLQSTFAVGTASATAPFTWVVGDFMEVTGTYEAA
jgi:hypothetical protein